MEFKNRIETFRRFIDMDGEKMFVENATTPDEQWPSTGKIEFRNFSMKYREDLEHVLKEINLTINPGEKIGIVGRTGAGKTSLTRALFRLIDSKTCNGSIVIDGQDIFSLNIGDLRPRLGVIPQEPTMFEGTFRQNLDPLVKHDIENMWSAIIKCGIVEDIEPNNCRDTYNVEYIDKDTLEEIKDRNDGWEMPAWLLMRNRKIVVLDEATANVDLETDQHMQELIRSEFKDCTVLTIAHRLETIMNSDRIIVMDNGSIAEIGSPSELLEKNGHFAELVKANDFGK
ncbi:Multidrug resistance-associated protein 1 [Coemansia erecta]|nr:Multidrug resistance-associated protein 1 [Coemansia erecta]